MQIPDSDSDLDTDPDTDSKSLLLSTAHRNGSACQCLTAKGHEFRR
jgi:hypothetical protein